MLPDLYVVVAMDDPALEHWRPEALPRPHVVGVPHHPGGLPLAAARNLGFAVAADAGIDVVVGLDVDCMVGADAVGGLPRRRRRRARRAVVGSGDLPGRRCR